MDIFEQVAEMRHQEGVEQGSAEERENRNRVFVENLLKEPDFSLEKIASVANVSLDFVREVKKDRGGR